MSKIKMNRLSKAYDGNQVIHNIDMEVGEGELVVLLGPSGSGKTTLLHGIAGLVHMDQGSIYFDDECIDQVPIEKRNAVLVDQSLLLFPHMTLSQNIGFGLKMRGMHKKLIDEKVKKLIALLELGGHENKRPNEISGGQMQRVAIARALAIEPRVLLLDEPFSKLDIVLRKNMQKFVRDLQKKLGITMIMVTHDKEEALSMADKVAVLLDGTIQQFDTPDKVYESPASRAVADFFGMRNYIEGYVENGRLITALGAFKTHHNEGLKLTYVFRPEEILMNHEVQGGTQGVILNRTYLGDKITYEIACKDLILHHITLQHKAFQPGDTVTVNFDFKNAVYFETTSENKENATC
ncbi:MAG: ABC transporter ATP-binding protein [Firmicutes bacterium HGW-Firmicutes-5]|nr:MAG: ABC transporter ATP-binding protein [Firmicutes bacterium HGW-Firmicutes-5]